ncbi:MAG: hypothetical protein JWQ19_1973 [Subtercola sp.]|nr:hypothetical protein [Subtercola sp.]
MMGTVQTNRDTGARPDVGGHNESWPIAIDAALVKRLSDAVAAPEARVQLIRGVEGVGKSTLAKRVAATLRSRGFVVLSVVGLPELQNTPLGAFAPTLNGAKNTHSAPVDDRVAQLLSQVASSGQPHVLLVDNVLLLDKASGAALYQLVRVYGVRCIATARSAQMLTGTIERMHSEGFVDETELRPLTPAIARKLITKALGARVDRASMEQLVELTGGIPRYIREFVVTTSAARSLSATPGFGEVVIDTHVLPNGVTHSLTSRFAELTPAQFSLLQMLAVAPLLPRDVLQSPADADALQSSGLVARSTEDRLSLAHPLFSRVLSGTMSAPERRASRERALALLESRGTTDDRFRGIGLRVASVADGGAEPNAADLRWAAAHASTHNHHRDAIDLATRSYRLEKHLDTLLLRAASLIAVGRQEEADRDFSLAKARAQNDDERAVVASLEGTLIATLGQRLDVAVELATHILDTIPDSAARDYLESDRATWLLMSGLVGTVKPVAPHQSSPDAATALNSTIHAMIAAVYAADIGAARAAIARAEVLMTETDYVAHAGNAVGFARLLVLVLEGQLDDALYVARQHAAAPESPFLGMWCYGVALLAAHRGALPEARAFSARAEDQLRLSDFSGTLGVTVALRASVAAQLGDNQEALRTLKAIPHRARAYVKENLVEAEATAFLQADLGHLDQAAAEIASAVAHGIEARHLTYAALTAHYAVRLRRPAAVLTSLRSMTAESNSELIAAITAHAEAAAASDPVTLLVAAERLVGAGMLAGAADAARHAIDCASGSLRGSIIRQAESIVRLSSGTRAVGTVSRTAKPTGGLTERERMIAVAAARRERSSEIAAQLGLSVRTVDNHLRQVYRKLGIAGRSDLAEALRTESPHS